MLKVSFPRIASINPLRALLVAVPILATAAVAATPSDYVASRKAGYKQIGKANKAILDEVRGGSPSMQTLAANARLLAVYSEKIPGWFPRGSGPESGAKTAALPAIWADPKGFRNAAQALRMSSGRLFAAAKQNNLSAAKAAAAEVAGTCRDCHQTYRSRD
jgi:cytochrome c556